MWVRFSIRGGGFFVEVLVEDGICIGNVSKVYFSCFIGIDLIGSCEIGIWFLFYFNLDGIIVGV